MVIVGQNPLFIGSITGPVTFICGSVMTPRREVGRKSRRTLPLSSPVSLPDTCSNASSPPPLPNSLLSREVYDVMVVDKGFMNMDAPWLHDFLMYLDTLGHLDVAELRHILEHAEMMHEEDDTDPFKYLLTREYIEEVLWRRGERGDAIMEDTDDPMEE